MQRLEVQSTGRRGCGRVETKIQRKKKKQKKKKRRRRFECSEGLRRARGLRGKDIEYRKTNLPRAA